MTLLNRLLLFIGILLIMSFNGSVPEGRLKQFNSGSEYSVDEIAAIKKFSVVYIGNDPQFDGDEYAILAYELIMAPKKGEAEYFKVEGNSLPEEIMAKIKGHLKSGDKLIFDNVVYLTNQGAKKQCGPAVIYLK